MSLGGDNVVRLLLAFSCKERCIITATTMKKQAVPAGLYDFISGSQDKAQQVLLEINASS